jgi:hypothetical protein
MSCGVSSASEPRPALRPMGLASVVSLVCVCAALAAGRQDVPPSRPAFHHLHLASGNAEGTAGFYARLFQPASISRGTFFGFEGIRGDDIFLLVSPIENQRRSTTVETALWHFGWGAISIDQDYRSHLLSEVAWEPPFQGLSSGFHLHLNSQNAMASAEWYHRHFGGALEIAVPTPERARRLAANLVLPEAIVRFDRIALIIYPYDGPLAPVNAGNIADHIAFGSADLQGMVRRFRDEGVRILQEEVWLDHVRAAMVEGPDAMRIELVEQLTAR